MIICIIALWGYPHVKWEIELLSQITTTAPIFLQFNYFRQKYLNMKMDKLAEEGGAEKRST